MVEDHLEDAEGSPGARTTTKPRARGVSFRGGRASPPKDAPKDTDSPQRRHNSELSRPLSKRTPPPGMISSPTSAATGASGFINRQQLFKRSKSAPLNAAFGSRTQQDRGALPVLKRAASSTGFGPPSPERGPLATNRRRVSKQAIAAQQGGDYNPAPPSGPASASTGAAPEVLVHAFIDNTNTFSQVPRRSAEQMARRLSVGERGRPLASRIVVGSARSVDALGTWVSRYKELGCQEVYMDVLGDGLGGKESIVDDTLHANIVLAILRGELQDVTASAATPLCVPPRRVLVLYSGDTNENHGRVSFPECVELALSCGWAVEVIHKMPSLTASSYLNRSSFGAAPQPEPQALPVVQQLSAWARALQTFDMREPSTLSPTTSLDEAFPYSASLSDDGSLSPPRKARASVDDSASQGEESGSTAPTSTFGGAQPQLPHAAPRGAQGAEAKPPALPCRPVGDKLIADVEEINRVWVQLQQASERAGESVEDVRGRVERMVGCLNALVEEVKRERSSPTPRRAFVVTDRVLADTRAYLAKCPGGRVLRNELRRQLRKSILPEGTYQNGCVDLVIEALEERGAAFMEGLGAKTEVVLVPPPLGLAVGGQAPLRCVGGGRVRGLKNLVLRQDSSAPGEEGAPATGSQSPVLQGKGF